MKLLNQIEIDSKWGIKTFELYEGDITQTQSNIFVLSIKAKFYGYSHNSVVTALHDNLGIDLQPLVNTCEYDLRSAFACWVSQSLTNLPFDRILCVEISPHFVLDDILKNIFVMLAILETRKVNIEEVVLPLIGTGAYGFDSDMITQSLLENSFDYLRRSPALKKIKFVEIDHQKAQGLNDSMNKILGQVKIILPKGKDIDILKKSIHHNIQQIRPFYPDMGQKTIDELDRIIQGSDSGVFEWGLISRKFLENLTKSLVDQPKTLDQNIKRIQELNQKLHISEWIIYYMNVLRVLGNVLVHDGKIIKTKPLLTSADIEIGMMCLNQILIFWLEYLQNNADIQLKLKTMNYVEN